ncbi:hypothetical protein PQX77_012198 [Marasmius sp. AFHP31]|nr:hypothetical protein PQX77_012198 [Marasmius sp. AFHP31]
MSLNTVSDNVDAVANDANNTNNNSLFPARAPPSPPDSPKSRCNNSNSASCTSPRTGLSRPSSSASSTSASIQSLHIASVPPSSSLRQHTFATSSTSPGLDAAITTNLPSSPSSRSISSYRSASVSPNPAAALHRATRRDQDASDIGSDSDVAEAQGLMRSLGFSSPIASPPPGANTQGTCRPFFLRCDYQLTMRVLFSPTDASLEEGEIRHDNFGYLSPSIASVARSPGSTPLSPTSNALRSPRQLLQGSQRLRNESNNGSTIPSSPEVMPTILSAKDIELPVHRHGSLTVASTYSSGDSSQSITPIGNVTPVPIPTTNAGSQNFNGPGGQNVDATGPHATSITGSTSVNSAISSLPSATSTLSSLSSMNSFHTASSSASIPTSVSTSVSSVGDQSLCGAQQTAPFQGQGQIVISESGTIQLPPPGGPGSISPSASSTLNPHAAEHIPSSNIASSNREGGLASSDSTSSDGFGLDSQNKTPNVYINGLPPHFPEDQLFELAAQFGEIRSVRSFTRHVGEKESGYGFVLFETVDAAEKCINALRKYRNLHPTFSKQVHKIPGIPFAQSQQQQQQDNPTPSAPNSGMHSDVAPSQPPTFKGKMERLADPSSTNLYIEGLPLSIDEPSLVALVSPHRIKSSRFFQTRLSNPPRIIAFVRLESRSGAEEVVERLHGRMVRGWNDPGSRISVRFADTSEQRELRRQERSVRGGEESSPGRLTIAQAALLNLRGRDQIRAQNIPVIGSRGRDAGAPTAHQVYDDFSSNAHDLNGPYRGGDYGHQSGRRTLAQTAPYDQPISLPPPASLFQSGAQNNIDPAMAAILGTLRANGAPFNGGANDAYGDGYHDGLSNLDHQGGYHQPQQLSSLRNQVLGDMDLNQLGYSNGNQYHRGGVAQARGGYTAAEEYILQSHANNVRRRGVNRDGQSQQFCHPEAITDPAVADFNVGVGVRGYRTQASTVSLPQSSYSPGGLPAVMEDDGQTSSSTPLTYSRSQILSIGNRMGIMGRGRSDSSSSNQQASSQSQQQQHYGSPTIQSQNQFSSNRNTNDHNQAHVRSTTLPTSTTTSHQQQRHVQHNSMSIPKSRNLITDSIRTTVPHQKHRSTNSSSSIASNDGLVKGNGLYNASNDTGDYTNDVSAQHRNGTVHYYHGKQNDFLYTNTQPRQQAKNLGQEFHHHQQSRNQKSFRNDGGYDGGAGEAAEPGSPPLVSPALTYSSRGSAGTLSPSTPFVGTFSQAPGSGRALETDA